MTPATIEGRDAASRAGNGAAPPAAARVVPFAGAAHETVQPAFTWAVTPGANAQDSQDLEVPAGGYLRHILIEVEGTGGVIGAGVLAADYPWNIFESVALYDTNGAPIFGPLDGYACLWANIFGGYAFEQDPRQDQDYVATLNASFHFRIPVEIAHGTGFGSISNQSAAATYKIRLRVRPSTQLYTTAPTTPPLLTIRAHLEAWSVPDDHDLAGNPQQQLPPGHGTSQYWSNQTLSVLAGLNTLRHTRVGNLIRNIVYIARDATGARTDTVFPDAPRLSWDGRDIVSYTVKKSLQRVLRERLNDVARDAGVYAFTFAHSSKNQVGDDVLPLLWFATVQSSRLELIGNATNPGSLQVITNDIAPVEVQPPDRFVETSRTGFVPERGIPAATPAGRG